LRHAALKDIYIVVLTVYLHDNNKPFKDEAQAALFKVRTAL
jgi:hypothetical protein